MAKTTEVAAPIVNTAPKEVETVTLTKKDVIAIAQGEISKSVADLIEKAIDDGDIHLDDDIEKFLEGADADTLTALLGLNASGKFKKQSVADSVKGVVEGAESGTIADALGLDSDGKLVKGSISGGTKLYLYKIYISNSNAFPSQAIYLSFVSNILESELAGTKEYTQELHNKLYSIYPNAPIKDSPHIDPGTTRITFDVPSVSTTSVDKITTVIDNTGQQMTITQSTINKVLGQGTTYYLFGATITEL